MRPAPPERDNIVLTGFMGTGKTTIGVLLADRLHMEFVDTDAVIEDRHGPIADIFRSDGEQAFRSLERELARELAGRHSLVISTGGGLLLDPTNVAALGQSGRVFCLWAKPQEILDRVTNDPSAIERPLLRGDEPLQRITDLLEEREAAYRRFRAVETSGLEPDDVVGKIIKLLGGDAEQHDDCC